MNSIITNFMSTLHIKYLKMRGYTKKHFVYSRQMDGYTERVRLAGSRWNHDERPWSFNIDFGVEFTGIKYRNASFPNTNTHASLERIVAEATGDYALCHSPSENLAAQIMDRLDPRRQLVRVPDQSALLAEIAAHIERASERVFFARTDIHKLCLSSDFFDRHFAIQKALQLKGINAPRE